MLLTALAIVLVLTVAPLHQIAGALRETNLVWLLAALAIQLLVRCLNAFRMQLLANYQGLSLGFLIMLRIILSTAFYGLFLPGGLAGGTVTFIKYRQYGASGVAAMINLLLNKGIAAVTVCALTLTAWLFLQSPASASTVTLLFAGFLAVSPLLFSWSLRLSSVMVHRPRLIQRLKLDRAGVAIASFSAQLLLIAALRWHRRLLLISAGFATHLLSALSMLLFGYALGTEAGPEVVVFVYGIVFLLALLPISFSNIGVREASMVLLLADHGIDPVTATAWSVLMYLGPFAAAIAGGMTEALCPPASSNKQVGTNEGRH